MKAKEFDKKFDDNEEDILQHCDLSTVKKINKDQQRVNVDMPLWMLNGLDVEAQRLGITRQSIIKVWLAEKLEQSIK